MKVFMSALLLFSFSFAQASYKCGVNETGAAVFLYLALKNMGGIVKECTIDQEHWTKESFSNDCLGANESSQKMIFSEFLKTYDTVANSNLSAKLPFNSENFNKILKMDFFRMNQALWQICNDITIEVSPAD